MDLLIDLGIRLLRVLIKLFGSTQPPDAKPGADPPSSSLPVVVLPPKPPMPMPPSLAPGTLQKLREELLLTHNRFRSEVGIARLLEVASLSDAAQVQASYLARNDVAGVKLHSRPSGRTMELDFAKTGLSFTTAGENAAVGHRSTVDVMAGWKSSSGHYKNIVRPAYTFVGFGHAKSSSGRDYWVAMFCG